MLGYHILSITGEDDVYRLVSMDSKYTVELLIVHIKFCIFGINLILCIRLTLDTFFTIKIKLTAKCFTYPMYLLFND